MWEKSNRVLRNTHLFLLVGCNRSDISSKTAVAAAIDLLVKNAGGHQTHALLTILLLQGGLPPLDLQDLGLDV